MPDAERIRRAYQTARAALLAERAPAGHWVGELSSSALSTATACSALAIAARKAAPADAKQYRELIDAGLAWILRHQNADGGWGDTDLSLSNIATTMLVRAALHLAERTAEQAEPLGRAEAYLAAQGDIAGLRRRYGRDKTFAVPILTNCALAGLVPWSEVSPLPFELACLPQSWYRFVRLPVVSYAIPALVAIGQARHHFAPSWNPLARGVRQLSIRRSLQVLHEMQPESGGYLEATPLTSFVVMSLAAIGRHEHPVTQSGLRFLVESARADGSWPIDTNLATWVTTLSINALGTRDGTEHLTPELLEWLLACQHLKRHRFTGADPGGWGWSDLSGAVPDADDTPGALMALHQFVWSDADLGEARLAEGRTRAAAAFAETKSTRAISEHDARIWSIVEALRPGLAWLGGLQNRDGGWPTFCRGWGTLPFDRSGTDLTAHALRAIAAWQFKFADLAGPEPERRHFKALDPALDYLSRSQRPDGSWLPLWFGNQHRPDDENPLYGTARVLAAYRDLDRLDDEPARRGLAYLLTQQNADGGWGGTGLGTGESGMGNIADKAEPAFVQSSALSTPHSAFPTSSVEETALVVEILAAVAARPEVQPLYERGVEWLCEAVETGRFRTPSPLGFYFAKLWYYEKLYPLIFTVGALRAAWERSAPAPIP